MKKLWYTLPFIPAFLLYTAFSVGLSVSMDHSWQFGVFVSVVSILGTAVVVGLIASIFFLNEFAEKMVNRR